MAQGFSEPDRRTLTLLRAQTWALNAVLYALLADVVFRSSFFGEAPWELFGIIGLAGLVQVGYAWMHGVTVASGKTLLRWLLISFIGAVVGGTVALFAHRN